MFIRKTTCRFCRGEVLKPVLDLGRQPPANAFLKMEDFEREAAYPLCVVRCMHEECGAIQLQDVVDPDILFRDYLYVSSTSPVFVQHFESYAERMHERLNLADALTVDIGSNDGILVKPLKALGAKALGVDPARDIAAKATAAGIETRADYFGERCATELLKERGAAKLITANNVFAHIDDLDDVVRGVRVLLSRDGLFTIEAPYLKDFLEKKLFDTVYHEHLSYLAIRPLVRFFGLHGMRIVDVEKVNTHGGSIRVMVAHQDSSFTVAPIVEEMISDEVHAGLYEHRTYEKFADEVNENKRVLLELLATLKREDKKIVGYGAPAKGNTLLNFMEIGPETLDYIVDDSPLKQGLYTPGTHIPVQSAQALIDTPPDYIFILAWNFAQPIMEKNRAFRERGGKFIIPVPTPAIIS